MSNDIAADLRDECARIIKRNFGIDRALGAIRIETVEALGAYIERSEEAKANCTCAPVGGFEIDTSRDTPAYRAMEQARIDRLLFDGAA
jgi:hypothetical protein